MSRLKHMSQCHIVCSYLGFYYAEKYFRKRKTNEEYFFISFLFLHSLLLFSSQFPFSLLTILYLTLTFHMASFWLIKSVARKCGRHGTVGLWSWPWRPLPVSLLLAWQCSAPKEKCILLNRLCPGVNAESGLFFLGKPVSQWPHLP